MKTGAKIQVAKANIPNSNQRNVFIEGPIEKFDKVKGIIDSIIEEHYKLLVGSQPAAVCPEMTSATTF
jgi:hypothetical protein